MFLIMRLIYKPNYLSAEVLEPKARLQSYRQCSCKAGKHRFITNIPEKKYEIRINVTQILNYIHAYTTILHCLKRTGPLRLV